MQTERIVRLFRDEGDQVIHIPRDLEIPGSQAILRKEGHRLIVEPLMPRLSLLELLSMWAPLDEEFPEIDAFEPIEDVDL
jgi:antitoxin VapB